MFIINSNFKLYILRIDNIAYNLGLTVFNNVTFIQNTEVKFHFPIKDIK